MGASKLRHAVLCCANCRHSLKLRRVRITEQFRLLGIEFNVILKVPVGIEYNITVAAPFSKTFGNPRFTLELTIT
jgi:hypothetical protein